MTKLNSIMRLPDQGHVKNGSFSPISILKFIIPFDRQTIESPLNLSQATENLSSVTTKRRWINGLVAAPGTFEGMVDEDRFRLLTSAEGYRVFGFARIRNLGRPVCAGRLTPAVEGCRADIKMRPQALMIAVTAYLFLFGMILVPLVPAHTWSQNHIDPKLPAAFPAIFVLNYAIGTAAFWFMRNRAVRALKAMLQESKQETPPPRA